MAGGWKKEYCVAVQLILVVLVFASPMGEWSVDAAVNGLVTIARYLLYIITIRACSGVLSLAYGRIYSRSWPSMAEVLLLHWKLVLAFLLCGCVLLLWKQTMFREDFQLLFIAYLMNFLIMEGDGESSAPVITYGVGMACSFFEGYLAHVIPSDGHRFVGFEENINLYESAESVVFPVKRLFIIIPKSLYSPPDLKDCNKQNRPDLPRLEACKSLSDVEKDVAGVKHRTYRNSAYQILRPGRPPVYVCAEFATPLHTLYRAINNRGVYDQLCDADVPHIVSEFCAQLTTIIARSPETRGKCELVHYDEDAGDNLASVLLDKIREIEPDFEEIILTRTREMRDV